LDIWERHYAGDYPFLHPPTFQNILRQAKAVSSIQDFNTPRQDPTQNLPPAAPEFLLAFLALTSKYQPNLVSHHSNRTPNPRAASEYYAAACKSKLALIDSQSSLGAVPSLSRVQTFLMLTLYEWGNCEGTNAWNHLSQAIREAQAIGLTDGQANTAALKNSIVRPINSDSLSASHSSENDPIEKETRNRTFWCCFILERFLSSGEYRPLSLRLQEIKVPLPISQPSFLFGKTVRTLLLSESFDALKYIRGDPMRLSTENELAMLSSNGDEMNVDVALESGPTEGVLSRYIRATEVFDAVVHWACAGGRL
jgi:Fungal specific transcription factor domain